ncbi:MAG: ChuX/HutX family heme-like substrate-binding protein, partial [Burkholderiales bacterium]
MMLTAQSEKKLIREAFSAIRQRGMRAKEAAEAIGLTEGVALAAFVGHETPDLQALPVQTALVVYPVKRQWIELLQALEDCGPVMALTRNETTVHEKTGIYQRVSGNQSMGLVMGADIDLRLFLSRWASGLVVVELGAASDVHPKISLQFFDAQGVSVHKVFPVPATNRQTWHNVLAAWVDMSQLVQFNSEPETVDSSH